MENIDVYLSGQRLYGDDFDAGQIEAWYADEKEGYANLGAGNTASYRYGYHAWNRHHAFRHLPQRKFGSVMGFGSAYGDELLPIIPSVEEVCIVDPSEAFVRETVHGVPARYIKPAPDGTLPLQAQTFDLITCLGVLHHIPNVSFVVREFARIMKTGGYAVVREPIVSMGDWRRPRPGLTKRERGIPLGILQKMFQSAGLSVLRRSLCGFPLVPRMFGMLRTGVYNSALATRLDEVLCAAFEWNLSYHASGVFRKLRPTSAFFVLRK